MSSNGIPCLKNYKLNSDPKLLWSDFQIFGKESIKPLKFKKKMPQKSTFQKMVFSIP